MKDSILNINVSCLTNVKGTVPEDVNLLTWLTSDKYRNQVENLRSIQDEDLQKTIKKTLPCITPSGRFSYRDEQHLIEHTGFMSFDIDLADNKHITNFNELKQHLSHIKEVAYCGISVRGQGYWGLIPIPKSTPEEHKQRFAALLKDFKSFKINLDPDTGDIVRLRIYSWDPEPYFNHAAKTYTSILKPKPQPCPVFARPASGDDKELTEAIIKEAQERRIDMTTAYKGEWFTISAALANTFGELGRGYFHDLSRIYSKYSFREADKMFSNCLRRKYEKITIDRFFEIASQHGINLKSEPIYETQAKVPLSIIDKPNTRKEVAEKPVPDIWHVNELEQFFNSVTLPTTPVKLNDWTTITDISLFISSHLAIIKSNNGKDRYLPYFDRLNDLKIILN